MSSAILSEHQVQDEAAAATGEVAAGSAVAAADGCDEHSRFHCDGQFCCESRSPPGCRHASSTCSRPYPPTWHRSQARHPDSASQCPAGCQTGNTHQTPAIALQ